MDHPDKHRSAESAGASSTNPDEGSGGERSYSAASSFGQLRTKRGHPIYSREDIREQYCINSKELEVFEEAAYAQNRLFGCLSLSHLPEHSPCNKSSLLPDCVKRRTSLDSVTRFVPTFFLITLSLCLRLAFGLHAQFISLLLYLSFPITGSVFSPRVCLPSLPTHVIDTSLISKDLQPNWLSVASHFQSCATCTSHFHVPRTPNAIDTAFR